MEITTSISVDEAIADLGHKQLSLFAQEVHLNIIGEVWIDGYVIIGDFLGVIADLRYGVIKVVYG